MYEKITIVPALEDARESENGSDDEFRCQIKIVNDADLEIRVLEQTSSRVAVFWEEDVGEASDVLSDRIG